MLSITASRGSFAADRIHPLDPVGLAELTFPFVGLDLQQQPGNGCVYRGIDSGLQLPDDLAAIVELPAWAAEVMSNFLSLIVVQHGFWSLQGPGIAIGLIGLRLAGVDLIAGCRYGQDQLLIGWHLQVTRDRRSLSQRDRAAEERQAGDQARRCPRSEFHKLERAKHSVSFIDSRILGGAAPGKHLKNG